MSHSIRIVVPWDPARLSANARLHWAERARLTKAAREAARLAWLAAGQPVAPGPVVVSLIVRRGRVMDEDGVWSGVKGLCDSLLNNSVTPDDSPRWVTLGTVTQETGARWRGREEVEFVIEEREEEEE